MANQVGTTNAVESKNREIKHDYLKKFSHQSLVSVVRTIIFHYIPDLYQRYYNYFYTGFTDIMIFSIPSILRIVTQIQGTKFEVVDNIQTVFQRYSKILT